MSRNVITVKGLSKAYLLGQRRQQDTFLGSIIDTLRAPLHNFRELRRLNTYRLHDRDEDGDDILWALKDIDFEVKQGEVLGIIGRNGAGKSTLLKILSRIAEPTRGRAEIRGRVSALLEVGTGFHPELTGRENVYLNGTILGMTRVEIDSKFDEIVDFSGVERFLDTPVKRYSSGMLVRLAFAVAAHLEPEILIVDEVLAVGDAEFQRKCLGKMQDVASGHGRTVLFVSHNMAAVRDLCSRVIWLRGGLLHGEGKPQDIISDYFESIRAAAGDPYAMDNPERRALGKLLFTGGVVRNHAGDDTSNLLVAGESASFELDYRCDEPIAEGNLSLLILDSSGAAVTEFGYVLRNASFCPIAEKGRFVCTVPRIPFAVGKYRVSAVLETKTGYSDVINNALSFDVVSSEFFGHGALPKNDHCTVMVDHEWNHVPC